MCLYAQIQGSEATNHGSLRKSFPTSEQECEGRYWEYEHNETENTVDHRNLENREVDEPKHRDALMCQREINFNGKSQHSVEVKLSVTIVVLTSYTGVLLPPCTLFEDECVNHGYNDQQS